MLCAMCCVLICISYTRIVRVKDIIELSYRVIVPGTRVGNLIKISGFIVDSEREGIRARKGKRILGGSSSTLRKAISGK